MNRLRGIVRNTKGEHNLSLVELDVQGVTMRSVVIDPPDADYLAKGNEVNILFKETEVVLGTPEDHRISLQNRLLCTVREIQEGDLLARVQLEFKDKSIESIVTAKAVRELNLTKGASVFAMIKTNEVLIQR